LVSVDPSKNALRAAARARRAEADKAVPKTIGEVFARIFFDAVPVSSAASVAAYVRTQSEADPKCILSELRRRGHVIALPSVEATRKQPLVFRIFDSESLVMGAYGIPMPPRSAKPVEPDVIIVPLVAFDRAGHRLGYGAGYYDRTIAALRARKAIVTVGLAYAVQEVDSIPSEAHDQRLDWIVTEKEAIQVRR
jgi:5-formyltetrahydrofolate cyclo-ligase